MKNLGLIFPLALVLSACEPKTSYSELPPQNKASTQQITSISLGQSWTVIDSEDVKAEWQHMGDEGRKGSVRFEATYKDSDGNRQNANFDVSIISSERLLITRKDSSGKTRCNYKGHIWTETDLNSYDGFSEDPDPDKRPTFYRMVTGTYLCAGENERQSWVAKINE